MTTVYLIRHGQKESEAGDPGLTKIGIKQSIDTENYLKKFPITHILSSPFKRTVETAIKISEAVGLDHSLHDGLVERMNWVDDGSTMNDFLSEWVKATNNREYVPKYGDSSFQTGRRIQQVIREFAHENSTIVLITHGGAILDFLRNIFGDHKFSILRKDYPQGTDYQMMNCAINKIVFTPKPKLELLNYIDHLESKTE